MQKLFYLLCLLLMAACNKQSDDSSALLTDTISATRYYETELLSNNYLPLYGKWELIKICGGIVGGCNYPLTFDYLEIKKFGIYLVVKSNKMIDSGKLKIIKQTDVVLQVNFIPDTLKENGSMAFPVNVSFQGIDNLNLDDHFADGFGYSFRRIK